MKKSDIEAVVRGVLDAVKETIQATKQDIGARFEALEQRAPVPGPKGDAGQNGRDAEPLDTAAIVAEVVKQIPTPKDGAPGKDGAKGDAGPAGDLGPKGEPGADGKSVTIEELIPALMPILKSMQAEWALDFERRAQAVFQKAIDAIPIPKDGKDGVDGLGWDDLVVEYDDKRTFGIKLIRGDVEKSTGLIKMPIVLDAGFWREGMKLEKGDGVTHGGSYWIAQEDTDTKPELGNAAYRLCVKRGRDGKDMAR